MGGSEYLQRKQPLVWFNRWRSLIQWWKTYRLRIWGMMGYLFYTVTATLLFLFVTFPYDKVEKYFLEQVQANTPIQLSLEGRTFLFPLGFRWDQAELGIDSSTISETFLVEFLQFRLALIPLILGEIQGAFSMKTLGGGIHGSIQIDRGVYPNRFHISGRAERLDMGILKRFFPESSFQGFFTLEWDHVWENLDILRGKGRADIHIERFSVRQLTVQGFPIEPFFVSNASGQLTINSGKGTLEDIKIRGNKFEVEGSGSLLLRDFLPSSLLNLNLTAFLKGDWGNNEMVRLFVPSARKGEKLKILGRGALNNTQWSLNGVKLNSLMSM